MITLTAAMQVAAQALRENSTALGITGQNLANQGMPGYARQIVQTQTDGYQPSQGLAGGSRMTSGDSRSQFAEQSVWYQEGQAGGYQSFTQNASAVSQVMGLNDVSGSTGIQNSLSQLFQAFSNWAALPNSATSENAVIQNAQAFAADISSAAQTIQQTVSDAQSQAQNTVSQINQLVGQVAQWNQQIQSGVTPNATSEAQMYSSLETLSGLAPITTQQNSDGTMSIMMNGTTSLLSGDQQFKLQSNLVGPASDAANPDGNPTLQILDGQGKDITSSVTSGQLGGLVNFVNNFAPSLIGNGTQQGALNQLAQGIADSVNATLGGSKPLFQYASGNATTIAQTLQVNPAITSSDLASVLSANPNVPSDLSNLSAGSTSATQINGESFTDFLNTTATNTSSTINAQQAGLDLHTQLLNQAQANREQVQGVSLETESVNLLQYQQAFEASSKVISVIDTLTETAINLVRS